MAITAADVKKLRDMTGAGMMDAKKALVEADGDFEQAVELLRVSGAAKAAKRDDRDASNGMVASCGTTLIQLGSETDFVAKNAEFVALAEGIAAAVDASDVTDKDGALALSLADGTTVSDAIDDIRSRIGEKIELVNLAHYEAPVSVYLHRRSPDLPPQVGVMVEYRGDGEEFASQVARQIASMNPIVVTVDEVPAELLETERRVASEKAREEGKPEAIIPKIVEGRLKAYYKDVVLLEQPSVYDDKKSVGQLAQEAGVEVKRFVRFATGA